MDTNKPIEIFLRQCHFSPNSTIPGRNRPEWFNKADALKNIITTKDPNVANLNIIFDKHFGQNINLKYSHCDSYYEIDCGNEAQSFLSTLDIVLSKNLPDDTIIYLLEDDYAHKFNWCKTMMEAFSLPAKYVTLYDHLDKYLHYPDLTSKIYTTQSSHWRTTPSTTNTYACKLSTLKNEIDVHKKYSIGRDVSDDNGKFLELGSLISSIPGWSTHCDDYMSPTDNWGEILKYTIQHYEEFYHP